MNITYAVIMGIGTVVLVGIAAWSKKLRKEGESKVDGYLQFRGAQCAGESTEPNVPDNLTPLKIISKPPSNPIAAITPYKQTFSITDGTNYVGELKIKDARLTVAMGDGSRRNYAIPDVASVENVHAQTFDSRSGIGGVIVGGIVAGPMGAALGASAGRAFRECIFTVTFVDGSSVLCASIYKLFNDFQAYIKVQHAARAANGPAS